MLVEILRSSDDSLFLLVGHGFKETKETAFQLKVYWTKHEISYGDRIIED